MRHLSRFKRRKIPEEHETINFSVSEKDKVIGSFEIDVTNPQETYQIDDDVKVDVAKYYPDYELVDGEPISKSKLPFDPAFIFEVVKDGDAERKFLGIGVNVSPDEDPIYNIELIDFTLRN